MVEAVLVIPLLLLLVFGMIAFAEIIHSDTVVLLASNQAARLGAVLYGKRDVAPADARQRVLDTARGVLTNNLAGSDFSVDVTTNDTDVTVAVVFRLRAPVPWWKTITGQDVYTSQHAATYRIEPS